MTRVSIIIPVANEAQNLPKLGAELRASLDHAPLPPDHFEILFIDDGSQDGTWAAVKSLAAADPRVRGFRLRRNFGKAAALTAGFAHARGDLVCTMDGDGQDDPAELPRFLAKLDDGFDVVSGWKRIRHDPWHKVWPSRLFNLAVSALTGCKLHDHNCGFKIYRSDVLREVRLYGELHRFIPVLAHARGFRVAEIEVHHRPRQFGHSKYGLARLWKGFLDLLTVRFLTGFAQRPAHVFGTLGLLSLLLGAGGLLYLAVEWLLGHGPIGNRPLLVYSATFFGLGAQLLTLGILAELVTSYQIRPSDCYSVAEILENRPHSPDRPE
jgi:glycosyltransferase involved in cell wall biosynthesis